VPLIVLLSSYGSSLASFGFSFSSAFKTASRKSEDIQNESDKKFIDFSSSADVYFLWKDE